MNFDTWKPIPGYASYKINKRGDVKNSKGKILKPSPVKGYLRLYLCKNGVPRGFYIHRLVLMAFVGVRPSNIDGAHLDGNPKNNNLSNLKWVTRKENVYHMKIHGTDPSGERNGHCRLTKEDIKEIRKTFIPRSPSWRILGKKFGVSPGYIISIAKGRRRDNEV